VFDAMSQQYSFYRIVTDHRLRYIYNRRFKTSTYSSFQALGLSYNYEKLYYYYYYYY